MNHLDLFSGIGGFALAARWAGFKTVAFIEKDPFCQRVLFKHWPDVPIYDDVKTYHWQDNLPPALLTAGFPCQPFSVAGKKKGKDDDRYLYPEVSRLIRESRPRFVILENVSGIIPMLDPILLDLEDQGYTWTAFLIPASAVQAPHKRERLWVIAYANGKRCADGSDHWGKGFIQTNIDRDIKKIQQKWSRLIPQSWTTFSAQEWLQSTTNAQGMGQSNPHSPEERKSEDKKQLRPNSSGIDGGSGEFNQQEDQPPVPGVDDGVPYIVDRSRALGNAIVPQVVYPFMELIKAILETTEVAKTPA